MNRNIALKRLKVYMILELRNPQITSFRLLPFASLFVDWNSSFNQDYWVTRMFVSQTIQHEWLNFKITCACDRSFFSPLVVVITVYNRTAYIPPNSRSETLVPFFRHLPIRPAISNIFHCIFSSTWPAIGESCTEQDKRALASGAWRSCVQMR